MLCTLLLASNTQLNRNADPIFKSSKLTNNPCLPTITTIPHDIMPTKPLAQIDSRDLKHFTTEDSDPCEVEGILLDKKGAINTYV